MADRRRSKGGRTTARAAPRQRAPGDVARARTAAALPVSLDLPLAPARALVLALPLVVALLLAVAARPAGAAQVWTPLGPGTASVKTLLVDQGFPDFVFAGTSSGLYRSQDGGDSWAAAGLDGLRVRALVQDGDLLVAGTGGGLLVDGTERGVFTSADGGQTWDAASTGLADASVESLAVAGGTFWAGLSAGPGSSDGGLFRSSTPSAGWALSSFWDTYVFLVAVDPRNPEQLFAGAGSCLSRYALWENDYLGWRCVLRNVTAYEMLFDPADPLGAWVATDDGVFASLDGGVTWQTSSSGLPLDVSQRPDTVFSLAATSGAGRLLAGTSSGVQRSDDGGLAWTSSTAGLGALRVDTLAASPSDTLFAGTVGQGVFRSEDRAESWAEANVGLPRATVLSLAVDPATPANLYLGSQVDGLYTSDDGGLHWTRRSEVYNGEVSAIAIDPSDPRVVYAAVCGKLTWGGCTYPAGIFKSSDGGKSWVEKGSGLPAGNAPRRASAVALHPGAPSTVYLGTASGLVRSADGGDTWAPVDTGWSWQINAIVTAPGDPGTIVLGSNAGILRSTDGAASWTPGDLGVDDVAVQALAVAGEEPPAIYAGTSFGVFRSSDGGATWSWTSTGLESFVVNALAVEPESPTTIYAATADGIFVSTNRGEQWRALSDGLTSTWVRTVAASNESPATVYAGTDSDGAFVLSPAVPDLSVTLEGDPVKPEPGEILLYTLTSTNSGDEPIPQVALRHELPQGVSFRSARSETLSCAHASGVVRCTGGPLAARASAQARIRVRVDAPSGTLLSSRAVADPEDAVAEGDEQNNVATLSTRVEGPDLTISMSAAPDPAATDATLVYTITVGNTGRHQISGVAVRDVLPRGVRFTSATAPSFACVHATRVVDCTNGTLAAGASASIRIAAKVKALQGSLRSSAVVDPLGVVAEADEGNNAASSSAQVATFAREFTASGPNGSLVASSAAVGARVDVALRDWNPEGDPLSVLWAGKRVLGPIDPAAPFAGGFELPAFARPQSDPPCQAELRARQGSVIARIPVQASIREVVLLSEGDVSVGGQAVPTKDSLCEGEETLLRVGPASAAATIELDGGTLRLKNTQRVISAQGVALGEGQSLCMALSGGRFAEIRRTGPALLTTQVVARCTPSDGSLDVTPYDPGVGGSASNLPATISGGALSGFLRREGDLRVEGKLQLDGAVLFVTGNLTVERGGITGVGAVVAGGRVRIKGPLDVKPEDVFSLVARGAITLLGAAP